MPPAIGTPVGSRTSYIGQMRVVHSKLVQTFVRTIRSVPMPVIITRHRSVLYLVYERTEDPFMKKKPQQ